MAVKYRPAPYYDHWHLPVILRLVIEPWLWWSRIRWSWEAAMIRSGQLVLPEGGYYRDARFFEELRPLPGPPYYTWRVLDEARARAAHLRGC